MTLTLDLPAIEEAALRKKAARAGMPLDAWALEVLRREALPNEATEYSRAPAVAARLAALDSIGAYNTRDGWPPLSDDAIYETYREREDGQL